MPLRNAPPTTDTQLDHLHELNEAVSLARQALEFRAPPDPPYSESLEKLADSLSTRFEKGGQRHDLDEAISLYRQVLDFRRPPNPLRPKSLNDLSDLLQTRFKLGGQQDDIREAIMLPRQALELQSPTEPLRSSSLNNLALSLFIQFRHGGYLGDLEESISLHQQALKLRVRPHPLRSMSLSNLANALLTRFEQKGQTIDLVDAISLHREGLELRPFPHPHRASSLGNLANALQTRFMQDGHQIDLDEAISLHRQAVDLQISPHPSRSAFLNNLAAAVLLRFEREGHRFDLDEAISLYRQALELRISPHPLRSTSLGNLAHALSTRFKQEGQKIDLHEAISLHRQALDLRVSPHPARASSLNGLAAVLGIRFEKEGHIKDLYEVISLTRQALDLQISPHPLRPTSLTNLASALRLKFEREGQQDDLDEAISLHRQAVELAVSPHPHRSAFLNDLADSMGARFEKTGQKRDLNEAISLYGQALELRPSPHPDQSQSLYHLAKLLIHAHSLLLSSNDTEYLEEAMRAFFAAARCLNQPVSLRLRIAQTWIKHANLYRHVSAIDAYDAALQALPKLAALSFDITSRQEALLTHSDGLARDASRFAIQTGRIDRAVEFIEAGRAVFWSQFLSLRSPFEQLYHLAPELADKLREIAASLDSGSHRKTLATAFNNQEKLVIDQETARLNRLHEEWSKTIDDVRQINGFEHFLGPRKLSSLQVAASDGPVVILIGNDDGSDILILTSANVRTIHLSALPNLELQKLVRSIQVASSDSLRAPKVDDLFGSSDDFPPTITDTRRSLIEHDEERGITRKHPINSDDIFRSVLKTLWSDVVKPVINILELKKADKPPVVRWCPTGLFSFLPIHAAGYYNNGLITEYASDYFISSYTPTIEALLTQNRTHSTEPFKMMVVVQSQELAATRKELENIEQHVSDDSLIKLGIPGARASVEEVASRLSNVAIVHFSCHGTQDRSNPLDSGLKLEDGYLRVSRIMKEKIPNGALAFLCACETAMGDEKLPDEAMSLGASLLFSGFRRVVATMWVMRDEDGPVIADAFYEELFRGPDGKPTREPDATKSAYALHMAVKKLRGQNVSFRRWVPFIHMGK